MPRAHKLPPPLPGCPGAARAPGRALARLRLRTARVGCRLLRCRAAAQRKRDVDARVLVVGGSDTAIAAVEELLAVPYLNFHSVTVLAPGGVPTSPPAFTADSLSFSEPEMRHHLLFARARVIPGEMLALDRAAKTVLPAPRARARNPLRRAARLRPRPAPLMQRSAAALTPRDASRSRRALKMGRSWC